MRKKIVCKIGCLCSCQRHRFQGRKIFLIMQENPWSLKLVPLSSLFHSSFFLELHKFGRSGILCLSWSYIFLYLSLHISLFYVIIN